MAYRTANLWATPLVIGQHEVRQVLVPGHDDLALSTEEGVEIVSSSRGRWPVVRGSGSPIAGELTAVLPVLAGPAGRVQWIGGRAMTTPAVVQDSYTEAIRLTSPGGETGLRRPQMAALHSILGFQSSGVGGPAVVVMPTGTGKTETMVAWMVAARPPRLLVVVPSAVLRDQVASKFETLGVLQREGVVAPSALRPSVVRLGHRVESVDEAALLVESANVIVTTPQALHASEPEVRGALTGMCSHLVVDEAHHAPAATWTEIVNAFTDRPVLLFTATPFRADGRQLPGRTIFRFPLREAQRDGYFAQIDFTAVVGLGDADEELARAAVGRLRADIDAGFDHVMLARAANKTRAAELVALYETVAADLHPRILVDGLPQKTAKANLTALRDGTSRIIVCVDMLGEGFDLPTLKVIAFHDPRRSLSPMIQLVGRVARTDAERNIGTASVFVSQEPRAVLPPMRQLLREDADWNTILSDITDRATAHAEEVSAFDASFDTAPADVPVRLLQPKMSAIAFRTNADEWNPHAALEVYGERVTDAVVSVSRVDNLAWFVLETTQDLRWGHLPTLQEVTYDLVVMFLDVRHGLLFIHGSDTHKDYEPLASAVLGEQARMFTGENTFRVFAGLDRLMPTNVGLLDAVDRDTRFSMYVGSHVETALDEAQKGHKTNTHIAARAFDRGESVSIAAAMSGRFWSMSTASGLFAWRDWCKAQGRKLTDSNVNVQHVFRDMIIPVALKERPDEHLLALEWPWQLYLGAPGGPRLRRGDQTIQMLDTDFEVTDHGTEGPFQFKVVTPTWRVNYMATVGPTGMHYVAEGDDADVEIGGGVVPLATWMNNHKPTLFLSNDVLITGDDRLLRARTDLEPFDRQRLSVLSWDGVDIRVESQGPERRPDSIQAHVAAALRAEQAFDVLIDDDRSGEAADLVGLRVQDDELLVTLVHCKYSSEDQAGGRVLDLYEVCGQAMRGARWRSRSVTPLFVHLDRRVRAYHRRTGGSAFEVGDLPTLLSIAGRAEQLYPRFVTIIAQPGLSAAACSSEQLRLLAGAETYVRAVTKGTLRVLVSV